MPIPFEDTSTRGLVIRATKEILEHLKTYRLYIPRDKAVSYDIRDYGLSVPTVYEMFCHVAPPCTDRILFRNPYGMFDTEIRSENFPIWFLYLDTFQYECVSDHTPSVKYMISRGGLTVSVESDLEFIVNEGILEWFHTPIKITVSYGLSEAWTEIKDRELSTTVSRLEINRGTPESDIEVVETLLLVV